MRSSLSFFLSLCTLVAAAQWSALPYPVDLVNRSVHFVNATTGYVGCYGDVRRTTDGGATWQSTSIGSDPLLFAVDLMGIQTFDANTVVAAGTNNANGTEYIVRSTDGGANWDLVHVRSWGEQLQDLHFPTSAVGYVVGDNGRILKSANGGLTWATQISNTGEHLNGVYFSSESVGMAVGNHVVLTTTNGGTTWTATSTNWYLNHVRTTDGNTWFACGEEGVVLRSSNFGENWSNISLPTNSSCLRITASTLQRLFVAAEYGQIYVTHNQGGLWERVMLPAGSLAVNDIQADASLGGVGYAVTEGGRVFKTSDLTAPALPIPRFQSIPGTVCTGTSVTFQNLSSPTYTSTWKLDGATVANSPDYSTVFPTTGTYEVRLIVSNGTYTDSLSKSITVLQSETAEPFMVENYPETICPGFWETIKVLSSVPGTTYQVYANGQPYSAVVEGNGNTANFFEQVMQTGVTYTVVSKRPTPCGIVEYVAPVDVNVLAVADQNVAVNISPTVLCDPGPVSITILQSQLGITYRIGNASAPGNGGPLTITIPNVAVTTTFTIIGSNAMNCNRTLNTAPTVTYSPMIADFTLSSTTPFVGQTVTVIDNSAAVSWDWALGIQRGLHARCDHWHSRVRTRATGRRRGLPRDPSRLDGLVAFRTVRSCDRTPHQRRWFDLPLRLHIHRSLPLHVHVQLFPAQARCERHCAVDPSGQPCRILIQQLPLEFRQCHHFRCQRQHLRYRKLLQRPLPLRHLGLRIRPSAHQPVHREDGPGR